MFLAVFHLDDLQCPVKVLTHLDDINAALEEADIRCAEEGAALGLDRASQDSDALLLDAAARVLAPEHAWRDVLRMDGLPGYVDASEERVEPEAIAAGSVVWHIVRGGGQLVVRIADTLAVLECAPGEKISLGAGTLHWFRPASGQRCIILRTASSAEALERRPSGSDMATRFPGFGL